MNAGKRATRAGGGKTPPDPSELAPHLLARRARIVEVALEMLEKDEYDAIQIREVAENAGVALGTLYRYFTSKEHLYAAVLLEWATNFEDAPPEPAGGDGDEQRIRALLMRAVRAFERRPQVLRAEIALEASSDPNARVLFDQFADRYGDVMRASIVELAPSDAEAIVEVVDAVLAGQLRAWALDRRTMSEVRRTIDRAVTLAFHGPTHSG